MSKRLLPLLALIATPVPALTEQEAVLFFLARSPDIRILSFGLASDSLSAARVESEAGLILVLSGDRLIEVHPRTVLSWSGSNGLPGADTTQKSLSSSVALAAGKKLPGGGEIRAGASEAVDQDLDSKRAEHTLRYSLAAVQPLLKGAFGRSDTEYRIRVGRIGYRISAEQFRGEVEKSVAQTRSSYWNWVQAHETARIRETEVAASETELAYARSRFALGEKSEIDTLSAALEALRADEKAMTARVDEAQARESLGLLTGLDPDSIALPERPSDPALSAPALPELLDAATRNDAALRVLLLNAETLEADRALARNSLLPKVDLEAGVTAAREGTRVFRGNRATAAFPNSTDPYVGIRFSYDLLNRRDRLARAAADVKLASNAVEREKALRALEFQLRGLLRSWAEDTARLSIRAAEIRIAEKSYAQTQKSYELGAADNLSLIKARNDLFGARLNQLFTRLSLKQTEIAFDRATGKSLNKFGVTLK